MGKRQIRIFESDIDPKLPELVQKELNLILKNNLTLRGTIYKYDESKLYLKDTIHRKHVIDKSAVAEIIIDHTTLY
ncbi:hypothetical protein [Microscilla marina]|uniref:Uncharacterized protein n=1 Tax=Microscilla marina ATCC 23134 TaxID=313606 RepID=A1ZM39_MICM2|nr:hypothetical protein [Microscilla marina]EAY28571.1 conserved hypothetical protein [Microscilla marina ATCC 23134]